MASLISDFSDMLRILSEENVEFLMVGAHALAAHGVVRYSQDIDFWVRPTADNAARVYRALARFGAPLGAHGITPDDFSTPDMVYQVGIKPFRIDLLTTVSGLDFDEAWRDRVAVELDGIALWVPSIPHLIRNKRASARLKDLADVEALEALEATSSDE